MSFGLLQPAASERSKKVAKGNMKIVAENNLLEQHLSTLSYREWWRTTKEGFLVLPWIILIHLTALVGLVLFPLPGWSVFVGALVLTWLGGLGTTICYHRALAHRSLKLNKVLRSLLIFFALFNGSGTPATWVAFHRVHHAKADTSGDPSSPSVYGFWWAHLRWLWQAEEPSISGFCPDLDNRSYRIWGSLQPAILAVSFLGGLCFGPAAFFWLGAIRLVFSLHAQCFVNSVCHSVPDVEIGQESSRNVFWLGLVQLGLGENWHRNHHSSPAVARIGYSWRQPDMGYMMICVFEALGLANQVRHKLNSAK